MKVLLINGSPNQNGCTATALQTVAAAIERAGIETVHFHIGKKAISGCIACYRCTQLGKCVIDDDVNRVVDIAEGCDGFVIGAPVYYGSLNGSIVSFLDRMFQTRRNLRGKPGACVVSARRAGTTASLDQLSKYFTIAEMPLVSSRYWNMVHGNTAEEVLQDKEGLQIMDCLGQNMAWLLRCIEAGRAAGVEMPPLAPKIATNFIR